LARHVKALSKITAESMCFAFVDPKTNIFSANHPGFACIPGPGANGGNNPFFGMPIAAIRSYLKNVDKGVPRLKAGFHILI
jgi:hypothetical protein